MGKGFRVEIKDVLNLPKCYDCGKKLKDGDWAKVYLNVKIPKIRCLDCHNNLVIDTVNGAGVMEYQPQY